MTAYYNEHDPKAAAWLRELIKAGAIAPGEVDERSIVDVSASDVRGFTQCHWFAGIGVWSYSLRQAGWRDDQRVWTASLPCQPFSAAGKQLGFEDERHLWPDFERLVRELSPAVIFGEQVASKAVNDWLDVVLADLEVLDFTVGAIAWPAAGIGAPHIRDRTYWVADKGGLADAHHAGLEGRLGMPERAGQCAAGSLGMGSGLADAESQRRDGGQDTARPRGWACIEADGPADSVDSGGRPGPTNGLWRDADWLFCRDGKWRPVEGGTQPLAPRSTEDLGRVRTEQEEKLEGSRQTRLKGYGNAVNAEAARIWIETCMEAV